MRGVQMREAIVLIFTDMRTWS